MSESVPVRCPACRREHVCTAPSYPCACGAPVTPPLDPRAGVTPVFHRVWDEDWITVHCPCCGRHDQWPRPELPCPCGTILRLPLNAAGPHGPGVRAADEHRAGREAPWAARGGKERTADVERGVAGPGKGAAAGNRGALRPTTDGTGPENASAQQPTAGGTADTDRGTVRPAGEGTTDTDRHGVRSGRGAAEDHPGGAVSRNGAVPSGPGRPDRTAGRSQLPDRPGEARGITGEAGDSTVAGGAGADAAEPGTVAGTAGDNTGAGTAERGTVADGDSTVAGTAERGTGTDADRGSAGAGAAGDGAGAAGRGGGEGSSGCATRGGGAGRSPAARRGAFRPVVIRTARDAVTDAALYLRWLGYEDLRRADQQPPSGVGLAARGLVAQVDPAAQPASLRDVECLWLTAMTESARCVYFSLTGYSGRARARADELGIPLFVLTPDGVPRPVNDPADALGAAGA